MSQQARLRISAIGQILKRLWTPRHALSSSLPHLKAVARALELAAPKLEARVVALEADGDLVDGEVAPDGAREFALAQ